MSVRAMPLARVMVVILALVLVMSSYPNAASSWAMSTEDAHDTTKAATDDSSIPPMLSPLGSYPNPLGITEEDRASFHPVVKFPRQCWDKKKMEKGSSSSRLAFTCTYSDHTRGQAARERRQLATAQEHHQPQQQQRPLWRRIIRTVRSKLNRWWQTQFPETAATLHCSKRGGRHGRSYIGRYDEDRRGVYESELFDEKTNSDNEDDDCTKRTVHMGMDLAGPINTPVYAFTNGTIYKAGYNPALGDYGNVIVVKHSIHHHSNNKNNNNSHHESATPSTVYALYGHLANASLVVGKRQRQPGEVVEAGQVLGWMGNVQENGGWHVPHVHFQLAVHAPETHDMPGVVCRRDRPAALLEYLDPRYVLGELY